MFDRFHSLLFCVLIRQLGRDSSSNRTSHTQRADEGRRDFFILQIENRFAVSISLWNNESIDENLINDDVINVIIGETEFGIRVNACNITRIIRHTCFKQRVHSCERPRGDRSGSGLLTGYI